MALYPTGNEHTFRDRNLLYTPVILNGSRDEWDQPSMKSSQVVYHEASPQALHRVSLFTLMAKDWFEDNFILHSVWFRGGREWIGQTDILWKAIPSSFTQGTEGQQMPRASALTWNVSYLPSRTWLRTALTHFSIQYLKLEQQEGLFLTPAQISENTWQQKQEVCPVFRDAFIVRDPWWLFWAGNQSLHFFKLFLLPVEDSDPSSSLAVSACLLTASAGQLSLSFLH